jgi:hypothetical protein
MPSFPPADAPGTGLRVSCPPPFRQEGRATAAEECLGTGYMGQQERGDRDPQGVGSLGGVPSRLVLPGGRGEVSCFAGRLDDLCIWTKAVRPGG